MATAHTSPPPPPGSSSPPMTARCDQLAPFFAVRGRVFEAVQRPAMMKGIPNALRMNAWTIPRRSLARLGLLLGLIVSVLAVATAPALARTSRVFYTIEATKPTPTDTKLYVGVGGVGLGNRSGDPVMLLPRFGPNGHARVEWRIAPICHPCAPVVEGGTGFGDRFRYTAPYDAGKFKLVNRYSGMCLTTASLNNGTLIRQYKCRSDLRRQVWSTYNPPHGRPSVTGDIRNYRREGKCLDVKDYKYSIGTPLHLWRCHAWGTWGPGETDWNQEFTLVPSVRDHRRGA